MNISVFYGVPNEAYQIPNIFSMDLDGFVKSRHSGENRSPWCL